jgi:hypothetical protein
MKKLFFLLLPMMAAIWLTTLGGCVKIPSEAETTFRACGKVLEFGTNKPIPDAEVAFSKYEGDVLGGSTTTPIGTYIADKDGHFCHDGKISIIAGKAAGFYPSGDDFIFVGQAAFDDYKLVLYPEAWLKVSIRNESGAEAFSGPSVGLAGKLYTLNRDEETSFITDLKGNKGYKIIYDVYPVSGGTSNNNLDAAKITFEGSQLQPSQANSYSTWVEITPTGHDTSNLQIIY